MKIRKRRKRGGKGIWNEGTGNNKFYTVNTAPRGKKRKLHHFSMPPAVDPKEKANQKKKGTKELRNLPKWRQPEGLEKRNMPRIHVPKTCWKINKGKLDNNELFKVNSKEEKKERRTSKERFALREMLMERESRPRPDLSKGETFLQELMKGKGDCDPYKMPTKVNLAQVIPKLKDTNKQRIIWKKIGRKKDRRNAGSLKLAALGLLTGEYTPVQRNNGDLRVITKCLAIARKADLGEVARAAGFSHVRHLKAALEAINGICKYFKLNLDGSEVEKEHYVAEALARKETAKILKKAWELGNQVEAIVTAYATGLINHPCGKLLREGNSQQKDGS